MHSIVSGILIGTSYIPFPPWAILFAMVPLWLLWINKNMTYKRIFFYGFATQFILAIIGFHWIVHTVVEFGRMPTYVGIIALVAFAATQNLHIPIAGIIWKVLSKYLSFTKPISLMVLGVLTAILEAIYPMIFQWNIGYTWLYSELPIYQIADMIGFQGLSFLTFLYNALFAICFLNLKNFKKLIVYSTLVVSSFIFLNVIGIFQQKKWSSTDSTVSIGVIQANIGNIDKHMSKYQNESRSKVTRRLYRKYFELTRKFKSEKDVDLIVWPEASFPKNLNHRFLTGYDQRQLIQFIKDVKTPIILGGFSSDLNLDNYYNSIFLFDENAKLVDFYKKTHLLAFGEYLPGVGLIPGLKKWLPEVSHFSRGKGPKVSKFGDLNIGYQICYEGLYPGLSAELSNQSANIIINVTNDSWFGHTVEPYQHLYMTMARAIETRIPIVRSTNTGISSAILADGTFLEKSPEESEWFHEFVINYRADGSSTLFSKIYQYITMFELIFLIGLLLVTFRKTSA